MNPHTAVFLLCAALIICIATLCLCILYNNVQWRKLENILQDFQKQEYRGIMKQELLETRESKISALLRQILNTACFKEAHAIEEKDHVMELVSDLSHQLKTPLANIVMDMELLQNDSLTEEQRREFLSHTKSQADKMQWLMEDLLKASKLENGIIHFETKHTGIKQTIAAAVSSVYAQALAKQIDIITGEFTDFPLDHNPKWTAEALTNILENAIKYSPEKSRINILINRLDIYSEIMITDQGPGIPPNEYNRIFKRFYRGHAAENQEGCGLGLYLAQLIAQCEKGYITVSSRPGQGSCFHIFLLNNKRLCEA